MDFSTKVPYANLVMYLHGNSTPDIDAAIQKLQKDEPAFKLLFDLINDIQEQNSINFNRPVKRDTLTFEQLESLLENLFAGNANRKEKQLFIDLLLSSPSFYRRLMMKLHQMSPALAVEEIPEFAGEFKQLRSDAELLRDTIFERKTTDPSVKKRRINSTVDIIRRIIEEIPVPSPRVAIPAIAVVLVLAVFSIGITSVPYDNYWEKPVYVQFSELHSSELRSGGESSETSEILRQYNLLKAVFGRAHSSYRNEQYADVIQTFTLPKAQTAVQAIETWVNTVGALDSMPGESNVAEMQRLVEEYYFYLGTSYIGNYRKEKKSLFKISDSQHITKAILALSQAQKLADSYRLNTEDRELYYLGLAYAIKDRELYYLGLAYAINKKTIAAQSELIKVGKESAYFPKAQALMAELN
jgi:hypothetical protein